MIQYSQAFFIFLAVWTLSLSHLQVRCSSNDLLTIQAEINKLQNQNMELSKYNSYSSPYDCEQKQKNNSKIFAQSEKSNRIQYAFIDQIQQNKDMYNDCFIQASEQSSHFLFQTPKSSYILVNNFKLNQFSIYSHQCKQYAQIHNSTVKQVYCDRGLCDEGNVVILTSQINLVICSQITNFTSCTHIVSLKGLLKGEPVGGLVRNKGPNLLEVYIADSAGQIITLDSQVKVRLSIPMQKNSKISQFLDIHPYPLIISSRGWIYTFDNTKYTISLSRCPYLFHKISRGFISHPYSSTFYAFSSQGISKMQLKSQPRTCQVLSKYYLGDQVTETDIVHKKIGQYRGNLFIGKYILNTKQRSIKILKDCGQFPQFNFQMMKNNYRKGFFTFKCCSYLQNNSECKIYLMRDQKTNQTSSKNNTIIMIILLFVILLLVFYFLKSTTPNLDYDQELKYDHNLQYKNEVQQFIKTKQTNKSYEFPSQEKELRQS